MKPFSTLVFKVSFHLDDLYHHPLDDWLFNFLFKSAQDYKYKVQWIFLQQNKILQKYNKFINLPILLNHPLSYSNYNKTTWYLFLNLLFLNTLLRVVWGSLFNYNLLNFYPHQFLVFYFCFLFMSSNKILLI